MLRDNVDWKWSDREQKAFDTLKEKLSDAPVLTHFSEKLPLKLDTDASNYGIGAVISHVYPRGEERPIAYASRTLNKSERNYLQIEKEALSIVFGVRNADCLSRLPLNDHVRNEHDEVHEILQLQLESLPVSVNKVRKATRPTRFCREY